MSHRNRKKTKKKKATSVCDLVVVRGEGWIKIITSGKVQTQAHLLLNDRVNKEAYYCRLAYFHCKFYHQGLPGLRLLSFTAAAPPAENLWSVAPSPTPTCAF